MRDRGKTRAWEKNRWMEKKYKKKELIVETMNQEKVLLLKN